MPDRARLGPLDAECRTFTRYLLGADPSTEVLAAYRRAHEVSAVEAGRESRTLDAALLALGRQGPLSAQAADAYAAAFAKSSVLRRKLVLLVAILESRGHTASALDTAVPGSRTAWVVEIAFRVARCVGLAAFATLAIVPLRMWYSLMRSSASDGSSR